jgi:hypothetical protein
MASIDIQRRQLFRRRAAITIASPVGASKRLDEYGADVIEITDMRFRFKVKKTLGKEPNTCEIEVTNLSEQSRAELQGKVLRVTLAAGYAATLGTIFVGDSRDIDSAPDGPDWTTTIQLGDGERGYRHGRTSNSFKAGTLVDRVLRKIADDMQLDSTTVGSVEALRGRQYVAGYVAHGRAARELDRVLRGYGLEWSIQDGKLQILEPEKATVESVVELDADSGLIGSPTLNTPGSSTSLSPFTGRVTSSKGKPTLKARSLLQPEIRPGRRVRIDSVTGIRGLFKVTEVTHSGDTSGSDWFSDFEGVQVDDAT